MHIWLQFPLVCYYVIRGGAQFSVHIVWVSDKCQGWYIYRENNYYEKIVVTSVQNVGLQQPKSLTESK